jgi:hypothetical protein
MARIRTLKPEYWQDEKLSPLPPLTRLVFLGLISQADDAGRLVDSVRLIDGLLFPQTEDSCAESLQLLASLGVISRGPTESGQRIIQVVGWHHQKVDHPNLSAALPPILDPGPSPKRRRKSPDSLATDSRGAREALARDSRLISVPTINDLHTNDQGTGSRGAREPFADLWERWPKKEGKLAAQEKLGQRLREGVPLEEITAGVDRYLANKAAKNGGVIDPQYIHNLGTFLGRQKLWLEEWAIPARARNPTDDPVPVNGAGNRLPRAAPTAQSVPLGDLLAEVRHG